MQMVVFNPFHVYFCSCFRECDFFGIYQRLPKFPFGISTEEKHSYSKPSYSTLFIILWFPNMTQIKDVFYALD